MVVPTTRSIAAMLGISRSTVSAALNGSRRVNADTAELVRRTAKAVDYHHNELTGAVMSELKRRKPERGAIAVLGLHEPGKPAAESSYHAAIVEGAGARARALGFQLETIVHRVPGAGWRPLNERLRRGSVQGLLLLPTWESPDFSRLDWASFSGVYTDYLIERPPLHSIYPDHFRAMTSALQRAARLGYRRQGLFLPPHSDERIQNHWEGALLAFQAQQRPAPGRIPVLKELGLNAETFRKWFRRHRPDVVVGHRPEAVAWMEQEGARIPETHGFICLNLHGQRIPCAGLDLQPRLIGAWALDLLAAQLLRHERGIPPVASATAVPARWVDGATLRVAPPVRS